MLRPRKNNLNNLVRPKMLLITGSVEMEKRKMMEGALEEIKKMEAKKRLFEKKERRRRRRKCYFRAHWNWRRER